MSNESTNLMRRGVGRAVMELRRRKRWDQTRLAREIQRYGRFVRQPAPTRQAISRWEAGARLPSRPNRVALAKIALAQKQAALHEAFAAPVGAWQFLVAVLDIGIVIDPERVGSTTPDHPNPSGKPYSEDDREDSQ